MVLRLEFGLLRLRVVQGLSDKVALVTGGASGLGRAIAQRLASEGARVVITDIQVSLGQATADEIGCKFLAQDVTDEVQWNTVTDEIQQQYGGLHILINNAGILGPMDTVNPQNTRLAEWRNIFRVNVESVLLGCQAAIPKIHASGGGAIVNISSVAGLLATPYATAYGASKATVRQLTKSVAQYCAEEKLGIRCNSVHPGNVRTPLWDRQAEESASKNGISFEAFLRKCESAIPLGDFTHSQDVASAVAFLASGESRHITGAKLIVDGGIVHCDTYRAPSVKQ